MRSINPTTGKPYPRKHPVRWDAVRDVLRYRQVDKRLRDRGYRRVEAFAPLLWESPHITHKVVGVVIAHEGQSLYVKLERR